MSSARGDLEGIVCKHRRSTYAVENGTANSSFIGASKTNDHRNVQLALKLVF